MNILLVHNNYKVTGGAEVFYHEVGRILTGKGQNVAYFSARDDEIQSLWHQYFPPVASYRDGGLLARVINFPRMVFNSRAKEGMARLITDFKPDIIHAFAIYVQLTPAILDAAREAGVPVVISCNDYKHICSNYKLYHHGKLCEECKGMRFYRAFLNRCCHGSLSFSLASSIEAYVHNWLNIYRKNVHTFLFASKFMAQKTEEFWGKDSFRWRILQNPFDARKHKIAPDSRSYALYFGRIIDEKGVDVLLEAVALAQGVQLIVVGDGPDLEKMKIQATAQGLTQVSFVGEKWGDELDPILRNCRFVVVPSLWHENFPYVILQSFAIGKPVIGSNRGGIPELISHDVRGLVYDANDAAALAGAMLLLMTDSELAKKMGTAAKHFVDVEFNDERFYANLMQIYTEVLS